MRAMRWWPSGARTRSGSWFSPDRLSLASDEFGSAGGGDRPAGPRRGVWRGRRVPASAPEARVGSRNHQSVEYTALARDCQQDSGFERPARKERSEALRPVVGYGERVPRMCLVLRPVAPGDEDFLFEVYVSTRADEVGAWGWDLDQQHGFLRMQF